MQIGNFEDNFDTDLGFGLAEALYPVLNRYYEKFILKKENIKGEK